MMVIVHWVLYLAPIGVFALVYPVGFSAGIEVVGALGYYVLLVSGLCVVVTLALYPATALGAGIPMRRFTAAAAPAQAFSTRSSLASLPVMLAVDVIPDTFATVGNVTAQLSLTAMIAQGSGVAEVAGATLPPVATPPVAEGVLPQVAALG